MTDAVAAYHPFSGGESLALYRPSPWEKYFLVSPGIEVSVHPLEDAESQAKIDENSSGYNRQGHRVHSQRKGVRIDTYL